MPSNNADGYSVNAINKSQFNSIHLSNYMVRHGTATV